MNNCAAQQITDSYASMCFALGSGLKNKNADIP